MDLLLKEGGLVCLIFSFGSRQSSGAPGFAVLSLRSTANRMLQPTPQPALLVNQVVPVSSNMAELLDGSARPFDAHTIDF